MKMLVNERLSAHKSKTPEGYLLCTDAVLARTGNQEYRADEIYDSDYIKDNGMSPDQTIEIQRNPEDVFDEKAIVSFENKPVTLEHPEGDVNPSNYNSLAVGFVRDVHKGTYDGQPVLMGNILLTDENAIQTVLDGDECYLSCGYDCEIENNCQKNIRGNHVALCECPRAGFTQIQDSHLVKRRSFNKEKFEPVKDADKFVFKLSKKKDEWGEYIVRCYKNGVYYENGSYHTDDWEDAMNTVKMQAKQFHLNAHQQGSVFVADSEKTKDDDSYGFIFNKLYNSDYDGLDEVKKDYDKIKNRLTESEKKKVIKEIANTFAESEKYIADLLKDSNTKDVCDADEYSATILRPANLQDYEFYFIIETAQRKFYLNAESGENSFTVSEHLKKADLDGFLKWLDSAFPNYDFEAEM